MGKIGAGMKPRVKNPGKKKETVMSVESPTAVGQEKVSREPVFGAPEGDEKGSQMQAEEVQNSESSVAPSYISDLKPEIDLEAAMKEGISQGEKLDEVAKVSEAVISCDVIVISHELPDGSHMAMVTIPEGWWEPVAQWAQEGGVTVEQWLSDRLYEYISSYGAPAGKR